MYRETDKCNQNSGGLEHAPKKTVSSADVDALPLDSFEITKASRGCGLGLCG